MKTTELIKFVIILLMILMPLSCKTGGNKTDSMKTFEGKADTIKSLVLKPIIKKESDTNITFILEAKRILPIEKEYIPSSETFIVEIMGKKGQVLWNSGEGMDFLQVIMPVEPKDVDSTYQYIIEWNGKDADGKLISRGNLKVRMLIPAKPMTYYTEMEVDWGVKSE